MATLGYLSYVNLEVKLPVAFLLSAHLIKKTILESSVEKTGNEWQWKIDMYESALP